MLKKPSFLERLTGSVKLDARDDAFDEATEVTCRYDGCRYGSAPQVE